MANISAMMEKIIAKELDDRSKRGDSRTVEYIVETDDKRSDDNIATVAFKFNKPIPENEARIRQSNILKQLSYSLNSRDLGIVDAMLRQYRLDKRIGRKRTKGKVKVHFGDHLEQGRAVGINTVKGKLVSELNLKGLLELAAKDYLIKDMKMPDAPLKHRTGRFSNSLKVVSAKLDDNDRGRVPNLSIFYTYMTYPYATFDPMKSTRPAMYTRPSYGARNPQKLIGEALAKAARDIIHSRYNIHVKQVN